MLNVAWGSRIRERHNQTLYHITRSLFSSATLTLFMDKTSELTTLRFTTGHEYYPNSPSHGISDRLGDGRRWCRVLHIFLSWWLLLKRIVKGSRTKGYPQLYPASTFNQPGDITLLAPHRYRQPRSGAVNYPPSGLRRNLHLSL